MSAERPYYFKVLVTKVAYMEAQGVTSDDAADEVMERDGVVTILETEHEPFEGVSCYEYMPRYD